MFEKLFTFVRNGIKNAILGGIQDAQEEIALRLESPDIVTIEANVEGETNGKPTTRRRSLTR